MEYIKSLWSTINSIYTSIKAIFNWIFPQFEDFPDNEAGELMRRYMAKKGWLDEISSDWCARSFFNKLLISVGIVLSSGLVGLILGAPTIIIILSGILIGLSHTLLVAHEHHRRECAMLFAEEALALNEILQDSINFFKSATDKINEAAKELKTVADDINENSAVVGKETEKVKEENAAIIQIIEELQAETPQLTLLQEEVISNFAKIEAHVKDCDKTLTVSAAASDSLGRAASDFSSTVQGIENSHNKFSHAVDKLCLFVNSKTQSKSLHANDTPDSCSESDSDDFLNDLIEQNEEDDRLLTAIGCR